MKKMNFILILINIICLASFAFSKGRGPRSRKSRSSDDYREYEESRSRRGSNERRGSSARRNSRKQREEIEEDYEHYENIDEEARQQAKSNAVAEEEINQTSDLDAEHAVQREESIPEPVEQIHETQPDPEPEHENVQEESSSIGTNETHEKPINQSVDGNETEVDREKKRSESSDGGYETFDEADYEKYKNHISNKSEQAEEEEEEEEQEQEQQEETPAETHEAENPTPPEHEVKSSSEISNAESINNIENKEDSSEMQQNQNNETETEEKREEMPSDVNNEQTETKKVESAQEANSSLNSSETENAIEPREVPNDSAIELEPNRNLEEINSENKNEIREADNNTTTQQAEDTVETPSEVKVESQEDLKESNSNYQEHQGNHNDKKEDILVNDNSHENTDKDENTQSNTNIPKTEEIQNQINKDYIRRPSNKDKYDNYSVYRGESNKPTHQPQVETPTIEDSSVQQAKVNEELEIKNDESKQSDKSENVSFIPAESQKEETNEQTEEIIEARIPEPTEIEDNINKRPDDQKEDEKREDVAVNHPEEDKLKNESDEAEEKKNENNEYKESKIDFSAYIFEKRDITINSTDDNLTKLRKVSEMIYYNCLHYLTFSHVFLSRYLAYPYNYFVYTVFGYILACLLGVGSGDDITVYKKIETADQINFIEKKFKSSVELIRKMNEAAAVNANEKPQEKLSQASEPEIDFNKLEKMANEIIQNQSNTIKTKINKLEKIKANIIETENKINGLKSVQDNSYKKFVNNLDNLVNDQIELMKIVTPDY